jgi:hypothetical protein
MFDPQIEKPLTFGQAAKLDLIPRRRRDRPIHPSCIARWATQGLDGVRLDSLKIGRTWCTSRESLVRFFQRLTRAARPELPQRNAEPSNNSPNNRADRALDRAGI